MVDEQHIINKQFLTTTKSPSEWIPLSNQNYDKKIFPKLIPKKVVTLSDNIVPVITDKLISLSLLNEIIGTNI